MRDLTPLDYERARGMQLLLSAYAITRKLTSKNGVLVRYSYLGELFVLEKISSQYTAYPTVELGERRLNILRKNSSDAFAVTQIVDALLFLGYLESLPPEMAKSHFFTDHKVNATQRLASTIGYHAFSSYTARDKRGAEDSMGHAEALFEKALRAIVNLNSFTPGDPLLWKKHLAIAAIDIGGILCAQFRRLPTMTELRDAMEEKGLGYGRGKDIPAKWREMFRTAGLGSLPKLIPLPDR